MCGSGEISSHNDHPGNTDGRYQDRQSPDTFDAVSLGIQQDSSTCGFWAGLIAFGIVLSLPITNAPLGRLTATDAKHILGSIYGNYLSNPEGLSSAALAQAFNIWHPQEI